MGAPHQQEGRQRIELGSEGGSHESRDLTRKMRLRPPGRSMSPLDRLRTPSLSVLPELRLVGVGVTPPVTGLRYRERRTWQGTPVLA